MSTSLARSSPRRVGRLEVVALDHDSVRQRLPLDLLEFGTGPPVTSAIQRANAAGQSSSGMPCSST
jgi:hypothetical protein